MVSEKVKETLGMLILTRRVGETLMIGDDVTVTVLGGFTGLLHGAQAFDHGCNL